MSRRDTDSVQLNTLDPKKESADSLDRKCPETGIFTEPIDVEHGHLQEIEVDVDKVLHDVEVKDVDADTSPYPEGMAFVRFTKGAAITNGFNSQSCCSRDR